MGDWVLHSGKLEGQIQIPPSKSQSIRALLFASLAQGRSVLRNLLDSPDIRAMAHACEQLGARVRWGHDSCEVTGVAGKPRAAGKVNAGNSGLVLRFIGAVAGLCDGETWIDGDASIRQNRPIAPLVEGLLGLGVRAAALGDSGHAPLRVKGPWKPGRTRLHASDSQPVSGLVIAAAFACGPTTLELYDVGERPWLELTFHWLRKLGVEFQIEECYGSLRSITVQGNSSYSGFEYTVPADFSSLAFPLVGMILTGGTGTLSTLDWSDPQGDKRIVEILRSMGANLTIDEAAGTLHVESSKELTGAEIDVNDSIDALPILAVAGCCASGKTLLTNAAIARKKECDRIACMAQELRKMGARVQEHPDGLEVWTSPLMGDEVDSHNDHRVAMALAIAGLVAKGETIVRNVGCVTKTYPGFGKLLCLEPVSAPMMLYP